MKQILYVSQLTIALASFLAAPCIAMDGQAENSLPAAQGQPEQASSNNNQVPNNRVRSLQTLALAQAAKVISNETADELAKLVGKGFRFGPHVDLVKLKKALAKKEWDKEFYLLSPEILDAYFLSLGFTQQDKSDIAPLFWRRYEELFPNRIVEILKKMKEVGLQCHRPSYRAKPDMLRAVQAEAIGEMKLAMHFGMAVDQRIGSGMTPLMLAAEMGSEAMALLLIQNGANVNAVDDVGERTPLMFAVLYRREKMVRLLLENGACVSALDWRGCGVLSMALDSFNPMDANPQARDEIILLIRQEQQK